MMPTPSRDVQHPRGVRRVAPRHPAEQLDAFAALAGGDAMLNEAVKAAYVRLQFFGTFMVWQIRLDLIMANRLDGSENTACLGALHSRMLVAFDHRERVPTKLPEEYLKGRDGQPTAAPMRKIMQKVLDDAHGNLNSCWRRMTIGEKATAGNRKRQDG